MPSSEKMTMKRKRRRSKDAMERTELRSEATRLLRDVQYLQTRWNKNIITVSCLVLHFIIMLVRELQREDVHVRDSLCDFEDPQQPDAPEDREAQRSHSTG